MTRRVVRLGLVAALVVLALLLVRAFVFAAYRVDSGSMAPTIHGSVEEGEVVLVRWERAPALERFDLLVFLREGDSEPVVKRVVGLPGEEIRILGGDPLIDGHRLEPQVPRPAPVPVFDSHLQDLREDFELEGDWEPTGLGWRAGTEERRARASFRHALTDDHLDPRGQRVSGRRQVGDAELACEVLCPSLPVVLSLALTEEGDEFEARVKLMAGGALEARIWRRTGDVETVLVETTGVWVPGSPLGLTLSNVDDTVALDFGGPQPVRASYDGNTPLGGGPDPRLVHRRPRAWIEVSGAEVDISWLQLSRDLHYTASGTFGTAEPIVLGPNEVFLLGDNSAESVDGREWGPVTVDELLGRPVAVVWPPDRIRLLRSTQSP